MRTVTRWTLLSFAVLGLTAIDRLGRADDWPVNWHDSQRTSSTSDRVVFPLTLKWELPAASDHRSAVAAGGTLFYLDDDCRTVVAVDARTGVSKWSYQAYASARPTHIVDGETVFICPAGATTEKVHALDALTGAVKWVSTDTVRDANYPLAGNGLLYVFGTSGVSAFEQQTGQRLWHRSMNALPGGALSEDNSIVYSSEEYGHLYAFNALNGTQLWCYPSAANPGPSLGAYLMAWPVVVDNLVVYGGGYGGNDGGSNGIIGLNAVTGQFQWMLPSLAGGGNRAGYAVAHRILYSAVDNVSGIYAYDLTSMPPTLKAVLTLPQDFYLASSPIIYDYDEMLGHTVLVRARDQASVRAYRFDALAGTWTALACQDLFSSTGGFITDGMLYLIGHSTQKLYAFGGNAPPVANAGPDQTVEQENGLTKVVLDGSASFDPDNDPLMFEWSAPEGVFIVHPTDAITEAYFPCGTYNVMLTVSDNRNQPVTDSVSITVLDKTPPKIDYVGATPSNLWPPDHRMAPVTVRLVASDNCTSTEGLLVFCQVRSSEPDDAKGDGTLIGDVDGKDGYSKPVSVTLSYANGCWVGTVYLRAERDGTQAGRNYSITCDVWDFEDGNMNSAACVVVVPHDQGKGKE